MKTQSLFGIQFAGKKHYKAQLLKDFGRWKAYKQVYLARERNQFDVITKLMDIVDADPPAGGWSEDERFDKLDKMLDRLLDEKEWSGLYEEYLGEARTKPDREGGPNVSQDEVKALLEEHDCRHYLFTGTALEECQKLDFKTPLNLGRLKTTYEGKRQINFGDYFIRYEKRGQKIVALSANFTPRQEATYLQHTFFSFDLEKNIESPTAFCDHVAIMLKKTYEDRDHFHIEFDKFSHELLYKMIFFLDLAEAETILLPGGSKYAARSSEDHLRNLEPFPITIVTANWNRSMQIEPSPVAKHEKLQPCGPGGRLRKRIEVESYYRRTYTLKAKKELEPA